MLTVAVMGPVRSLWNFFLHGPIGSFGCFGVGLDEMVKNPRTELVRNFNERVKRPAHSEDEQNTTMEDNTNDCTEQDSRE